MNNTIHRYYLQLSYNGKNYVGWQIQPNGNSVQETICKALSTILKDDIQVTGCGRTDAGVHAKYFVAHFDTEKEIADYDKLLYSLNSFLPFDIAIQKIERVAADANSRFDATSRSYEYWIIQHKDPFLRDFAYRFPKRLDFEKMNQAARLLYDFTDFTSFSKLHTDVKTNNCDVTHAEWTQRDGVWVFTITANRFLRNMVRAIVGTLLDVGLGKVDLEGFAQIIEQKDRNKAGFSVPAQGLYLTDVKYPYFGNE